jgi:hypothetical protein
LKISGNEANGIPTTPTDVAGMGGGAVNAGLTKPSSLSLINTTVADNYARTAGGALGTGLLDPAAMGTATLLQNTLIGNNTTDGLPGNCTSQPSTVPTMFSSLGNNLEDGNTCNLIQSTDHVDTDPLFDPLADNGGPTLTHALNKESPAIDAGTCVLAVDQRGMPRPFGNACDIGAFEWHVYIGYLPLIFK